MEGEVSARLSDSTMTMILRPPLAIPFLGGSILFLLASPLILDGFLLCKEVSATAM